jgi:poly(hydroxyalkanoate) depolymerase family esterase
MIVMLHGANQDPDDFATGTRMNILAEEARYIVVYPEQPQSANAARCWNWFRPGDQVRESGEAALIAELTREVMSTYNADSTRIYVAGMSAGGAMAVNLAVTYADLYAAAGIHSGIPYGTADDALSAMSVMNYGSTDFQFELLQKKSGQRAYTPLIAFHGDQDNVVHPRNCDELRKR